LKNENRVNLENYQSKQVEIIQELKGKLEKDYTNKNNQNMIKMNVHHQALLNTLKKNLKDNYDTQIQELKESNTIKNKQIEFELTGRYNLEIENRENQLNI